MRFALPLFAAMVVSICLNAAAHDMDMARSRGAYSTVEALNADRCARLCADDGICMAWTYRPASEQCSFSAILAEPTTEHAAISGVSDRAPRAMVAAYTPRTAVTPGPEFVVEPAVEEAPMPPPEQPTEDIALLGGPEGDATGLRP